MGQSYNRFGLRLGVRCTVSSSEVTTANEDTAQNRFKKGITICMNLPQLTLPQKIALSYDVSKNRDEAISPVRVEYH